MTHAAAQLIGDRSHQCDATATFTHSGTRAYVLLDGIGSSDAVQRWTGTAARRLARTAARAGDAEGGLRALHAEFAAEPARQDPARAQQMPAAVAVVAVRAPDRPLAVAWCGDARAYLLHDGVLHRLTRDHNQRQQLLDMALTPGPFDRNIVTSFLGDPRPDPVIGSCTAVAEGRLLLASDGAYEPLEDSSADLTAVLQGSVRTTARTFVGDALSRVSSHADNATVLIADLEPSDRRPRIAG